MLINSKKIINIIEEFAPLSFCEDWDNSGFLVGNIDSEINKVMITLDVDERVVDECIEKNIDLIISHHPVIFNPIYSIIEGNYKGRILRKLIKNDIHVYCGHTNLDIADGGINTYLADLFKLENIDILDETGIGRIGNLKNSMDFEEVLKITKKIFDLDRIKFSGNINKKIKKIAICSGAGSDYIKKASDLGADLFITGDLKYHEAQIALEEDFIVMDCGHFETENVYMKFLANYLTKKASAKDYDVKIILSEEYKNPFFYI